MPHRVTSSPNIIISPISFGISINDQHRFQVFAAVSCDLLWHYCKKAFHDALSFDVINVSQHINKISIEHFAAWHIVPSPLERWLPPTSLDYKVNFDAAI